MTVLKILGVLLAILALIWSVFAINEHAEKRYSYKPFNMANTGAMVAAIVMIIVSLLMLPDGHKLPQIIEDTSLITTITEENSNSVVLAALSMLVAVATYANIALKTNVAIATFAIAIQIVAAAVIIFLVVLALMAKADEKNKAQSRLAR